MTAFVSADADALACAAGCASPKTGCTCPTMTPQVVISGQGDVPKPDTVLISITNKLRNLYILALTMVAPLASVKSTVSI